MFFKWCLGYKSVGPNWKKQEQMHKELVEGGKEIANTHTNTPYLLHLQIILHS